MNQHQRKFLLEAIEKQYKRESSELQERKPKEPSLNNYLIAAILDGSFVIKKQDRVRELILDRVRTLGKGEALLQSHGYFGRRRDEGEENCIMLPASLLFELPKPYDKEFAQYESDLAKWEAEKAALESSIEALRIKVQIGSDKALEVLVEQADTLCSMSLTASNKLLLGNGK